MTNATSLQGLCACVLLFISSCTLMQRNPRLRSLMMSERQNPITGLFFKASIIGRRLRWVHASACLVLSVYILVG
jgi:hypothetical protein